MDELAIPLLTAILTTVLAVVSHQAAGAGFVILLALSLMVGIPAAAVTLPIALIYAMTLICAGLALVGSMRRMR